MAIGHIGKQRNAAVGTNRTGEKPSSHDTSRVAWAKPLARVGEGGSVAVPDLQRRHPSDPLCHGFDSDADNPDGHQ